MTLLTLIACFDSTGLAKLPLTTPVDLVGVELQQPNHLTCSCQRGAWRVGCSAIEAGQIAVNHGHYSGRDASPRRPRQDRSHGLV